MAGQARRFPCLPPASPAPSTSPSPLQRAQLYLRPPTSPEPSSSSPFPTLSIPLIRDSENAKSFASLSLPTMEGKRAVESLGWLTESAIMPKKIKAIEGVGAASIVDLKAQLYRTQEEARKAKESPVDHLRARRKPLSSDLFSHKNAGVDSRNTRDKLEMKAENDGSVSYAALEKKAELYDKLARGEHPDEEDKEKYCVDFFSKTYVEHTTRQPEAHDASDGCLPETDVGGEDGGLLNGKFAGPGRKSGLVDREEHKRFVMEAHAEADHARQKATTLKMRRKEEEDARREKLRQAFLKKKLEKLTSLKPSTGDS